MQFKEEKKRFFLGGGAKTNHTMDKLQNDYGIAIWGNPGNLNKMKKAVHATLFHVASSSTNQWHKHCPKGTDS